MQLKSTQTVKALHKKTGKHCSSPKAMKKYATMNFRK